MQNATFINRASAPRIFICLVSLALVLNLPLPAGAQETSGVARSSLVDLTVRALLDRARLSVVTVEALSGSPCTPEWAEYTSTFGPSSQIPERAENRRVAPGRVETGSGVVIDARGFVLTCHHVVAGADAILLRLPNGRVVEAAEMQADELSDLAVLRIAGQTNLPPARIGNSDDIAVGDSVVSLGSPFGLGPSASAGIISAVSRSLPDTQWTTLLQSDAASNPGNSGGALCNLKGEVIGISEGAYGHGEAFQGISFAIPSNAAMRIARHLIAKGELRRGYLGCTTEEVTPNLAKHLGLRNTAGVVVTDLTQGSPASRAGVQIGDVLTKLSSEPIRDGRHLYELLEEPQLDRPGTVTVFRRGVTLELDITIALVPTEEATPTGDDEQVPANESQVTDDRLGLVLDELSPDIAKQIGFSDGRQGVLITHVKRASVAHKQGVCAGMLVLRVEDRWTPTLAEYQKAVQARAPRESLLMLIAAPQHNHHFVFGK